MRNESNNEVRIIDENYAKIYDSIQEVVSENFQNMDLDGNTERLDNFIRNIFNNLVNRFFGNQNDNPNPNFNSQQGNQNQEEEYQNLPNPNYQDIKDQMERDIANMVQQLLQQQGNNQQNQSQNKNDQQQGNNQQNQSQNQNEQQQNPSVQRALQSLVSKQDRKSVKDVDENFEGQNNQSQTGSEEEQFENMNLDSQFDNNQPQQSQQGEGQQQGQSQQGEGQQGDGNQQSESVQKALSTLIPKQGNGESGEGKEQQGESNGDMDAPNLDEETPRTATFNDSDELTKLNVDWTSEDASFRERERTREHVRTRIDDDMLDAIMKYLVKTNYYVKTYGLDKKNRKQIAKHFLLDLEHKIMTDTYSDVKEPLAFYIDMKGQCSELGEYNNFFHKLLNEKDVTIYFGYDGKVVKYLKVKKPDANLEFDKCDMCHYFQNSDRLPSGDELDGHYESKIFEEQLPLEEFIRSHRISRLIALSDYDAAVSIIRSSLLAKVYWFCTAAYCGDIDSSYYSLNDFRGEFIIADDKDKVMEYFEHIYDPSYENKQRKLQLKGSRW